MLYAGTTKEGLMYRVAAIALLLFSSAAGAAPVYLHCQFDPALDDSHRAPMDVTLNENESTVTWTFPGIGRTFSGPAAFKAQSVSFNGFTIDRTNLALRDSKMNVPDGPIAADTQFSFSEVTVGTCTVVQVKRAF